MGWFLDRWEYVGLLDWLNGLNLRNNLGLVLCNIGFLFGNVYFDLSIRNYIVDLVVTSKLILIIIFNLDQVIFLDLIFVYQLLNDQLPGFLYGFCLKDEFELVQ